MNTIRCPSGLHAGSRASMPALSCTMRPVGRHAPDRAGPERRGRPPEGQPGTRRVPRRAELVEIRRVGQPVDTRRERIHRVEVGLRMISGRELTFERNQSVAARERQRQARPAPPPSPARRQGHAAGAAGARSWQLPRAASMLGPSRDGREEPSGRHGLGIVPTPAVVPSPSCPQWWNAVPHGAAMVLDQVGEADRRRDAIIEALARIRRRDVNKINYADHRPHGRSRLRRAGL